MSEAEKRFGYVGSGNGTRGVFGAPPPDLETSQEVRGQLSYLEKELDILTDNLKELCQRMLPVLDTRPLPEKASPAPAPQTREAYSEVGVFILGLRDKVKSLTVTTTGLLEQIRI